MKKPEFKTVKKIINAFREVNDSRLKYTNLAKLQYAFCTVKNGYMFLECTLNDKDFVLTEEQNIDFWVKQFLSNWASEDPYNFFEDCKNFTLSATTALYFSNDYLKISDFFTFIEEAYLKIIIELMFEEKEKKNG